MATVAHNAKKRKTITEEPQPVPFSANVGLDMESEDEEEEASAGNVSDDGEVDEFPEIDTRSDSEPEDSEEEGDDEEDSEEDENEDESSSGHGSESELHIFPRSKTVISGITGQPKRVYPEIEPDYDSDSSTEDVRAYYLIQTMALAMLTVLICRLQIVSEIYLCIGMMIYPT